MNRKSRSLFLLFAAGLLLAACSVSRLAYLNAPPLALWYIGDYVDVTDAQKSWLKDRLSRAIAWHRQAELPQYQRSIETFAAKLETKVSVDDTRASYTLVRDYYHRLLDHLTPDFAEFLLKLDEKQIAQIERKFAADNKKMVTESVKGSAEDRRGKAVKKYIERFEDWTGKLSGAQREIIIRHAGTLPDVIEERLGDRLYRQTEIVSLIRARPPREEAVKTLRRLFIDTESWRRPEYTKKLREREERVFEIVSELSSTLTPEQRASVQRKARGYVSDISSIIASR